MSLMRVVDACFYSNPSPKQSYLKTGVGESGNVSLSHPALIFTV